MPSPEAICRQICAALEHEPRINLHRSPIDLHCEDGIVTVDGDAEHIAAKKLALELAAAVPGVDGLVDRLWVAPTRPMGDGAVRDHVRDALLQEPALATFAITIREKGQVDPVRPASGTPFGAIEVAIADGVVTLNGQVPSLSHKRLAGVLAWWVPGNRDVINGLAAEPPEEDSADAITDAVLRSGPEPGILRRLPVWRPLEPGSRLLDSVAAAWGAVEASVLIGLWYFHGGNTLASGRSSFCRIYPHRNPPGTGAVGAAGGGMPQPQGEARQTQTCVMTPTMGASRSRRRCNGRFLN